MLNPPQASAAKAVTALSAMVRFSDQGCAKYLVQRGAVPVLVDFLVASAERALDEQHSAVTEAVLDALARLAKGKNCAAMFSPTDGGVGLAVLIQRVRWLLQLCADQPCAHIAFQILQDQTEVPRGVENGVTALLGEYCRQKLDPVDLQPAVGALVVLISSLNITTFKAACHQLHYVLEPQDQETLLEALNCGVLAPLTHLLTNVATDRTCTDRLFAMLTHLSACSEPEHLRKFESGGEGSLLSLMVAHRIAPHLASPPEEHTPGDDSLYTGLALVCNLCSLDDAELIEAIGASGAIGEVLKFLDKWAKCSGDVRSMVTHVLCNFSINAPASQLQLLYRAPLYQVLGKELAKCTSVAAVQSHQHHVLHVLELVHSLLSKCASVDEFERCVEGLTRAKVLEQIDSLKAMAGQSVLMIEEAGRIDVTAMAAEVEKMNSSA